MPKKHFAARTLLRKRLGGFSKWEKDDEYSGDFDLPNSVEIAVKQTEYERGALTASANKINRTFPTAGDSDDGHTDDSKTARGFNNGIGARILNEIVSRAREKKKFQQKPVNPVPYVIRFTFTRIAETRASSHVVRKTRVLVFDGRVCANNSDS